MVSYNPTTGEIRGTRGEVVTAKAKGYLVVWYEGRLQQAHRVAFYLATGEWPEVVDHINRNRLDNRLCNLRAATSQINCLNKGAYSNNKSGHKGVYLQNGGPNFRVQVRINNKVRTWGGIPDYELACLIADEARVKYHESYATHN